jgi:hypothetical protein
MGNGKQARAKSRRSMAESESEVTQVAGRTLGHFGEVRAQVGCQALAQEREGLRRLHLIFFCPELGGRGRSNAESLNGNAQPPKGGHLTPNEGVGCGGILTGEIGDGCHRTW